MHGTALRWLSAQRAVCVLLLPVLLLLLNTARHAEGSPRRARLLHGNAPLDTVVTTNLAQDASQLSKQEQQQQVQRRRLRGLLTKKLGTVAGVAAAVAPGVTAYRSFNGIEAAAACQQLGLSPFGAQWVPSLAIEALSEEERGLNSDLNLHSNSELNPASTSGQPGGRRLRSGGQGRHAWGARRVLLVSKDRLKSSSLAPFDEAQTMHRHRSADATEATEQDLMLSCAKQPLTAQGQPDANPRLPAAHAAGDNIQGRAALIEAIKRLPAADTADEMHRNTQGTASSADANQRLPAADTAEEKYDNAQDRVASLDAQRRGESGKRQYFTFEELTWLVQDAWETEAQVQAAVLAAAEEERQAGQAGQAARLVPATVST